MKKLVVTAIIIVGLILLFLITSEGCTSRDRDPTQQLVNTQQGKVIYSDSSFTVVKFYDNEQKATVYLMDGAYSGGIFVLQDEK